MSRQFKTAAGTSDSDATDTIGVHRYATEPARVTVEYGLTVNMGNYESARVSISVSVPCYKEELEDAYKFAEKWAQDRVQVEVDSIRSNKTIGASPAAF